MVEAGFPCPGGDRLLWGVVVCSLVVTGGPQVFAQDAPAEDAVGVQAFPNRAPPLRPIDASVGLAWLACF